MSEKSKKIILIIARLMCLCVILFACNNNKATESFKLPDIKMFELFLKNTNEIKESEITETKKTEVTNEVETEAIETKETKETASSVASEESKDAKENRIVEKDETPVATRSKIDRITFVGDIFFSNKVKNAYDTGGIDAIIDDVYKHLISSSDICVGNLECAITDGTAEEVEKEYNLFTPEKYLPVLKEIGFDLFTIANNHIMDYGKAVLLESIEKLKKNKFSYIGAGENIKAAKRFYSKTIDGKKYAIFAASAVMPDESWKAGENEPGVNNGYDIAEVCKDIRDIRKEYDKIIVYMHWGEELSGVSNSNQKALAHKLVDFGADLVVGSHPHVVQEIEYYKNTPIVYSLGNFIYGSTSRETMVLEALFDYSVAPEGILLLCIHPGISNYEKVKAYWQEEDFVSKCKAMQDKCNTCYVANNGYVFTKEAVEMALKQLASESEATEVVEGG